MAKKLEYISGVNLHVGVYIRIIKDYNSYKKFLLTQNRHRVQA